MKWFLISLAIGLAASDKLDRTYLPPSGAQFSGGILGHHDAPLEPPHHEHPGEGPIIGGHEGSQTNFGINGETVNFGDKIPKVPVTTTSYAFSQTTTYPSEEGFGSTASPINPITGLPIQFGQENFTNGPFQAQQNLFNLLSQAPAFGTNIYPGFGPQGPTTAPTNNGRLGYDQFANQPLNQYSGQNVIVPGDVAQIPGTVYPGQNQGQLPYPKGQDNTEQQGFLPTGAPDSQRLDQYAGQNIVNPGGVVQIPGSNEGQIVTGQQVIEPSTVSPISLQPSSTQYGVNDDGSQGIIPQGTYTGQPINVPTLSGTEPTQTTYQRQEPINVGGSPSQYPIGNQNYGSSVPKGSKNVYQSESLSTIPSTYKNGVSSSTSSPGVPSSTSSYSSAGPAYRPERPQAAADRNAVILNYENVRTPNGYSYSFDTSNGIHADESGIVDNGTKAQGSYSYIGDDGKEYSVIYTADENGFQPRGDHLPTPPPIPEAIQRVIEQAARDKAAGIEHDGSYDEAKYGDKQYQGSATHRRPQKPDTIQFVSDQFNGSKDDLIKPIVGIKDVEYDEGIAQDMRKDINAKLPARRPLNQINSSSGDFDSPKGTFDGNSMPILEEVINQQNDYGTKKQGSSRDYPMSNGTNLFFNKPKDLNQNNQAGSNNRGPSTRPLSGGVTDITEKYPGSNVDVPVGDFSETGRHELQNGEGKTMTTGSPSVFDRSDVTVNSNFDSVTDIPIVGNKKQILRQRIKGNRRRPGSTGNGHNENKNSRPQGETYTQQINETPLYGKYFENAIKNQQLTQQDDTGYYYQQPNNKFEQNTFPTRFSPQGVSSTMKPVQRRTEYVEGTTLRPFMTPNVYDKNERNSQTTPNGYSQNKNNGQSKTRRPFTTIGVISPTYNSYTDYDDGDEYATDQNISDDRINSPTEKVGVTSRPYQSTQTSSRPQNIQGGQKTHINQKETVAPSRRTENSGTMSPGYTYGPTTQMPSHNSRFGSTEFPRRMKPQQLRPSATVPDSTTAVRNPVTTQSPLGTGPTDFKYQTPGLDSKYSGTNIGSGYPTTGSLPGSGSMSTTPGVSTPQDYYTSTYGPIQGYYSTTTVPPTYGYTQGSSGSQVPSGTPDSFQLSQDNTFQTGYHYGPPKSGPINLDGSGFFTPTTNSGIFPTSPTGAYQTTYNQGPGSFPSTTLDPVTSDQQGTFIPPQAGAIAPENSPFSTYQGNHKNGPTTPDYATTIISSTPGSKPVFQYPGSRGAQGTNEPRAQDTKYGHPRPTYSTTDSPSTIGTTPGSLIPSEFTGPSQGYSTTYPPGFQTTKTTFVDGPVDGFGRPIITEQRGSHPGYGHPTQGIIGPVNNEGPNFGGTEQSIKYPGSYDQTRVIGENFSGPKQPQKFDPKTGYHY